MKHKYITVHASATKTSQDIGVEEITEWHQARGYRTIGYHLVIRRDGTVQPGRDINIRGAHVKGYNTSNIGICLIGGVDDDGKPENNFTNEQWLTLWYVISELMRRYGIELENVKGHRDWPGVKKACPCFDVQDKLGSWDERESWKSLSDLKQLK
jgi:hypothetical protein